MATHPLYERAVLDLAETSSLFMWDGAQFGGANCIDGSLETLCSTMKAHAYGIERNWLAARVAAGTRVGARDGLTRSA